MSGTRLSRELALLVTTFDYGLADLRRLTLNAAEAAFWPLPQRRALIDDVIAPAFR